MAEQEKIVSYTESQSIFNVLARNFLNVFLTNLEDGTARILKLDGYITEGLDKEDHSFFPYPAVLKKYISERVHPEEKESLYNKLCLERLREIFDKRDEYVGNYRVLVGNEVHHYQFNYNLLEDSNFIICGFQNIDAIIEEHEAAERKQRQLEAEHKAELEEQFSIIRTLSKSFSNVYVGDLKDGSGRVLRLADGYGVEAIRAVENQVFSFDVVLRKWIKENVHPEDKERLLTTLDLENLREYFSKEEELVGTYRSCDSGVMHTYHYDFRRVDNTTKIVVSFRIIDDIVEEQERHLKKERELEESRLKEEKEHAEVVNSLSTIYSTIFRADIETNEYEILTPVSLRDKFDSSKDNFDDIKKNVINNLVEEKLRDRMREFLDCKTLAERLQEVNTISTEYKNQEDKWMEARFVVKRRTADGRVKEILYVSRDITKEKNQELEQQDRLSQALIASQQASKAKTTFLNSMSHDIRTPMNAILGFTALAQAHIDDTAQVRDYLAKISTSSNHLLSLINDILDMSRIESGTVSLDEKAVHMPDLLQEIEAMIQGLVSEKNLNLHIDACHVVHEDVLVDKLRLNQVLLNIVSNAIKFTQPGGDITIRLEEKPCSTKLYTNYEFSIKDNGIGMSADFMDHIFDTFSRERSTTVSGIQGTGLGMAITKNIVDMMGGDIKVDSEAGKGSIFTVTLTLRLVDEADENEPAPEMSVDRPLGVDDSIQGKTQEKEIAYNYSGKRALLVEDNELNCEIATAMLLELGMLVESVNDGDVAVSTVIDAPVDKYDIIFMDVQMPKMDGYTATREIRTLPDNKKANIPIVAMTANAFEEDRQQAYKAGMNGHIIKPIRLEDIVKVLEEIF